MADDFLGNILFGAPKETEPPYAPEPETIGPEPDTLGNILFAPEPEPFEPLAPEPPKPIGPEPPTREELTEAYQERPLHERYMPQPALPREPVPEKEKGPGVQPIKALAEGTKQTAKAFGGMMKGVGQVNKIQAQRQLEALEKGEIEPDEIPLPTTLQMQESQGVILELLTPEERKEQTKSSLKEDIKRADFLEKTSEKILKAKILKPDETFEKLTGVKGYIQDVIMMAPQIAGTVGAAALGGPAAGGMFAGVQISGSKYEQLTQEGIDPERAFIASTADALLQAPLEMLPIAKAFKAFKPGGKAIKEMIETGAIEFLTETFQKYPEALTEIWAKTEGKTNQERVEQFLDNWWEITKQGMKEGLVALPFGAGISATGSVVSKVKKAKTAKEIQLLEEIIEQQQKHIEVVRKGFEESGKSQTPEGFKEYWKEITNEDITEQEAKERFEIVTEQPKVTPKEAQLRERVQAEQEVIPVKEPVEEVSRETPVQEEIVEPVKEEVVETKPEVENIIQIVDQPVEGKGQGLKKLANLKKAITELNKTLPENEQIEKKGKYQDLRGKFDEKIKQIETKPVTTKEVTEPQKIETELKPVETKKETVPKTMQIVQKEKIPAKPTEIKETAETKVPEKETKSTIQKPVETKQEEIVSKPEKPTKVKQPKQFKKGMQAKKGETPGTVEWSRMVKGQEQIGFRNSKTNRLEVTKASELKPITEVTIKNTQVPFGEKVTKNGIKGTVVGTKTLKNQEFVRFKNSKTGRIELVKPEKLKLIAPKKPLPEVEKEISKQETTKPKIQGTEKQIRYTETLRESAVKKIKEEIAMIDKIEYYRKKPRAGKTAEQLKLRDDMIFDMEERIAERKQIIQDLENFSGPASDLIDAIKTKSFYSKKSTVGYKDYLEKIRGMKDFPIKETPEYKKDIQEYKDIKTKMSKALPEEKAKYGKQLNALDDKYGGSIKTPTKVVKGKAEKPKKDQAKKAEKAVKLNNKLDVTIKINRSITDLKGDIWEGKPDETLHIEDVAITFTNPTTGKKEKGFGISKLNPSVPWDAKKIKKGAVAQVDNTGLYLSQKSYDQLINAYNEASKEAMFPEWQAHVDKKTKAINDAKKIVEAGDKEISAKGKLFTDKKLRAWRKNYNKVVNEGGEGYIPERISLESYNEAKQILEETKPEKKRIQPAEALPDIPTNQPGKSSSEMKKEDLVSTIKNNTSKDPKRKIAQAKAVKAADDVIQYNPGGEKKGSGWLSPAENLYFHAKEVAWPILKMRKIMEKRKIANQKTIEDFDYQIDQVKGALTKAQEYIEENYTPIFDLLKKEARKRFKNPAAIAKEQGRLGRALSQYLVGKRSQWLYENKQGYEEKYLSREKANDIVDFFENDSTDSNIIKKMAEDIWAYNKGLIDLKLEAGIIDKDLTLKLREPYYVPFYRDLETKKGLKVPTAMSFTAISTNIKRMKADKKEHQIIDPLQLMQQTTKETIINAERVKVAQNIVRTAKENPEIFEGLIEKLPPKFLRANNIEHRMEIDANLRPQLEKLAKDLGIKTKIAAKLGRKRLAQFDSYNNELSLLYGATEGTYAHELGHVLDNKYKWINTLFGEKRFQHELNKIADSRYEGQEVNDKFVRYVRQRDEKIAEFMAMYITNRPKLQSIAPTIQAAFEANIKKDPTLKKLIQMRPSNVKEMDSFNEANYVLDNSIPQDKDVISLREDGKLVHYRVPLEMAMAVKNLHPSQLPTWLRWSFMPMTRLLKFGAVGGNIDFFIPNMFRDQMDAAHNAKIIPFVDIFYGVRSYLKNDEIFQLYKKRGGGMDSAEAGTAATVKGYADIIYGNRGAQFFDPFYWSNRGVLKGTTELGMYGLSRPFKLIMELGQISEMGTRLGIFQRVLKTAKIDPKNIKGENADFIIKSAVHAARQATLDFNRFGYSGRTYNEIFPFLNAAMEGVDRFARSWYNPMSKGKVPIRQLMYTGLMYGIYAGLTAWNRFADEENYRKISSREKKNNWIVMLGEEQRAILKKTIGLDDTYFKIPKGHIAKLIVNGPQMVYENMQGLAIQDGWGITVDMMGELSPIDQGNILPITAKLIIEPIVNYNLYWRNHIEKAYEKTLPAGQRFRRGTSETLKSIGNALNISPLVMQHEVRTATGGLGMSILWLTDWVLGAIGVQEPPDFNLDKTVVIKRFLGVAEKWKSDASFRIHKLNERLREIEKGGKESTLRKNLLKRGYELPEANRAIKSRREEKAKILIKKREIEQAQLKITRLINAAKRKNK